jgi:hypothetical protein
MLAIQRENSESFAVLHVGLGVLCREGERRSMIAGRLCRAGLDARAAAIVMRSVRAAVDTGRTVVATIHQPSIDIFESFDDLLLMKVLPRAWQVGGRAGTAALARSSACGRCRCLDALRQRGRAVNTSSPWPVSRHFYSEYMRRLLHAFYIKISVCAQRGGYVIYCGPLGKNSQCLVDYFEARPDVMHCCALADGQWCAF